LNEGLSSGRKLTLVSASAGSGKTTLVSDWIASCECPVAWLSLDEGDNDPARFLTYLIAALQTLALPKDHRDEASSIEGIAPHIGAGVLAVLQSPQPPPTESLLTTLLNEITAIAHNFILVLDDYHSIESKPVDLALTFLLDHLPRQMHLVIATREDAQLPISRLRARGQLTELRITDLRFSPSETGEFLNQVMGLNLTLEDINALEARTEGWIAGLQLAAIALQGQNESNRLIQSFTGSHRFVLDYLIEEVLQQQPEHVQNFLLLTSILDRMCGPLCDAVLLDPSAPGQATLEYIENANLFIVPLDNERRWYRYHHLFGGLLRQRLQRTAAPVVDFHIRASQWYEDNGYELEAFQHAVAANDVERAERLMDGKGIPLHLRGSAAAILNWLDSLPAAVMNARPSLWWKHASLLLVIGHTTGVEEKLQAAEAALQAVPGLLDAPDDKTRNLIGQIAAARATVALTHYDAPAIMVQASRALDYLPPHNMPYRSVAYWAMAFAYFLKGDRAASGRAYTEATSLSQAAGDVFTLILALVGLGTIQELQNQLPAANETYRKVLKLIGEPPLPSAGDVYMGLARICYEWNDLDSAEQHGQLSLKLAQQYESVIDRFIISQVFLARLKLARGNLPGAAAILAEAAQSARQPHFAHRLPEIAAVQVLVFLKQGNLAAASQLTQTHNLPLSQARLHLAQADPSSALAILEPLLQQMKATGWVDEQLKVLVLQVVAFHMLGEMDTATKRLADALALGEPGGFIRTFLDEGLPVAELLTRTPALPEGDSFHLAEYRRKLLTAFEQQKIPYPSQAASTSQPLFEPLSPRELEVLQLIAQGLSNREIGEKLFLALDTVKGHNRRIFGKLQVQNRDQAITRARELGLL
jgi:LuxR family transcriptional regulator, maltose regulon positive regulatory protein